MFSGATRDKTGSFWAVILLAQLAPQFWSNTCAFNGRQKWINHPLLKAAKLATCSIVAVEQRQRTSCQSLRSRRALNGFDSLLVVRSLFAATWKWRTVKIARGENDRYEIAGHENAGLIMLDKKHGSSWHETIAFLLWSYPTWTPAGMGKGGGHLPPFGNAVKCFCALAVTAKRSADELFMHYFHSLSSASGGFASRPPPDIHSWTPLGDFRPRPQICPPLKKSCGRTCYPIRNAVIWCSTLCWFCTLRPNVSLLYIVCVCQVIAKIAAVVIVTKKRSLITNEELVKAVRTNQRVKHSITYITWQYLNTAKICNNFMSSILMPRYLVRHLLVLHFQRPSPSFLFFFCFIIVA